jgi:hypothetical protein
MVLDATTIASAPAADRRWPLAISVRASPSQSPAFWASAIAAKSRLSSMIRAECSPPMRRATCLLMCS